MSRTAIPQDRHPEDPCRIAHDKWWRDLTMQGDPIRRPHLADEAFEAGWRAAMAQAIADRKFLEQIAADERRETKRWRP